MLLLLLAHCRKVAFEIVQPALPLPAKRLYPVGNILQSDRYQLTRSALGVMTSFDEARILQHLEMLRDRWLAELEGRRELGYGCLAQRKTSQDRAARGVSQSREGPVQPVGMRVYDCHVAI